MNISEISSAFQKTQTDKITQSKDADFGKNFATVLMNEMLKTTDVMGEKDGMSFPGMFRWQMAQFLADAISDKMDFNSSEGGDLKSIATKIATERGVDPDLVNAVIETESGWNESAISPKGAKGLMQLMDSTAEHFGVKDSLDPIQNIKGGVDFLKHLLERYDDTKLALAAYNAGEGNVKKYGGIPPFEETQNYVKRIMEKLEIQETHKDNK